MGSHFFVLGRGILQSIKESLKNEEFFHCFQPIFDTNNWKEIGYESFLRSNTRPNPEIVFLEARKEEQLYELDSWSIYHATRNYEKSGMSKKDGLLFLNIFPSTIVHEQFPSFINKIMSEFTLENQQIVFEVSESEVIFQLDIFKKRVQDLKNQGFLIAVDDMGKDHSCLKLIVETEPDFIKLDRYFAEDLHLSDKKQKIIKLLLTYSEQFDIKIILEGIETPSEMAIAKALGIPYCQGFMLGEPEKLTVSVNGV